MTTTDGSLLPLRADPCYGAQSLPHSSSICFFSISPALFPSVSPEACTQISICQACVGTVQGTGDSGRPWSLPSKHSPAASHTNDSSAYVLLNVLPTCLSIITNSYHPSKPNSGTSFKKPSSWLPTIRHPSFPLPSAVVFLHVCNTSVLQGLRKDLTQCQDPATFICDYHPPRQQVGQAMSSLPGMISYFTF